MDTDGRDSGDQEGRVGDGPGDPPVVGEVLRITAGVIDGVYGELAYATRLCYEVGRREADAVLRYKALRLQGLADGTITGSNNDLREASAQEVLDGPYSDMIRAQRKAESARNRLALSKIQAEWMKTRIRLMEVTDGEEGG